MKKFNVLFSLLAFAASAFAGPFDAWSSYRDVTINTTNADGGANVAGELNDIPVLVRLSNVDPALGQNVLNEAGENGASLRFSDASGNTALPFDIQYWSATRAAIWVRVPVVAGNATTTIRMFWDNEFVPGASNPGEVFKADNGYMAAWHLGNASGAAARPNAVTGGNPAVPGGSQTASMNPVPGIIGMADTLRSQNDLNNTTRDHLSIGGGYADFTGGITISVWAAPVTVDTWQKFIEVGNGAPDKNIALGRENATQNLQFEYYPGPAGEWSGQSTIATGAITQNEWQYFAATMGPDNIRRVYKNGELVGGPSAAGPALPVVTRNNGFIGRTNFGDRQYRGKMEAMRIANVARSDDWLKFEYETQRAGATAVTLGASEAQASTFAYGNISTTYLVLDEITPNTPVVNGTVDNISISPALPAGLSIDPASGVISGTPTAATAEDVYTVTAVFTEPAVTVEAELTITVNPLAPTDLVYPETVGVYALDEAIEANIPTVNSLIDPNQMVDTFTVSPALPAGLVLDPATGAISGTPTAASAATNYTVSATNAQGTVTAVVNITVLAPPGAPVYSQNPVTITGGLAAPIVPLKATVTGAQLKWSVNPALPAGLTLDTLTGTISGTPMSASSAIYTVTVANISGTETVDLNLTVTEPEDYATWTGTAEYTLNTAAAGVTATQEQFPLLVRLTSAHAEVFDGAEEDGSDIRFSKQDGSRLAYQVDHYDHDGQSAAFWVLVDEIEGNSTLDLRIHWGNDGAASLTNGGRVFNTANGFLSVFHMGGDQATPRPNAVAGRNPATPVNLPGAYADKAGMIGRADTVGLTGGNALAAEHFSFGPVTTTDLPTSHLTISMWIGTPNPMPGPRHAFTLAGPGNSNKQNNIYVARRWSNNVDFNAVAAGNGGEDGVGACCWVAGDWQLIHAVLDGNVRRVYQNGVLIGQSGTLSQIGIVNRQHALIGATLWGDAAFPAKYDEVRLSNVVRSADWARMEYQTQAQGVLPIKGLSYEQASYTFFDNGLAIDTVHAPTLEVGSATSFSISPALPPDLSLNTATGEITGTPTNFMPATPFVVTARNGAWVASQTLTLEIAPTPPGNIVYATNPVVYQAGLVASANVPTNDGTITSWSITPPLPAGLIFNTSTGVISGEPLVAAAETDYEVTGTGPEGEPTSADLTLTVLAPSEDFSTWMDSRDIILNTSASGSDVENTVTGFPVLVRLGAAEASIFSQAMADGADVRFAKANGVTRLPYEIVSWDDEANQAEIWVKVDSVYGNNSTQFIKMYWGKGGSTDSSNSPAVFNSSNGFAAVWHMGGTTGNEIDAGANAYEAVASNGPADTVGMTGRARHFNGTDQVFAVTGSADGALDFQMTDNYSVSAWVYATKTDLTTDGVQILNKGDNQYSLGAYGSNGNEKIWEIMTRGNNNYLSAKSDITPPITVANSSNRWLHITGTYRGGGVGQAIAESLYIDGVLIKTFAGSNSNNTGRNTDFDVHIGALAGGTAPGSSFSRYFVGRLDEVRLASATRSADWVRLDFESQKTYQSLTNIGYQAPVLAFSTDSIVGAAGFAIEEATLSITGTVTAPLSIDPPLPAGLTFDTETGSISGNPDGVTASTVHTVTATNNGATSTASIVITVFPPTLPDKAVVVAPVFDAMDVSPSSLVIWNRVAPPVTGYQLQGSDDSSFATVDLDTVVTDTSFSLSFAPYNERMHVRVRAKNIAGNGEWSDSVSFNTGIAPPAIAYTTPRSLVKGVLDSLMVFSTGGAVASYSVSPALPAGLTLNETTGRIGGTPTAATAAADYVITATNASGTATATVNIAVVDLTPVFSYATFTLSFTRNVAITNQTPTSTGGTVTAWSVTPALPAGLALGPTTGTISGTPTAASVAANYKVIGTNAHGADTVTLNITVLPGMPVIAYAGSPESFIKGVADSSLVTSTGGEVASYSVTPALPAGLTLNEATGRIGGTPTAAAAATDYTVSATNASGTATATVNITVLDLTPVISYEATVDSFTVAIEAEKNAVSTGGAVTAWSISPALPAGLVFSTTTGNISGTPTAAAAAANYTVAASNAYGADTVVLNLKVLQPTAIMGGAYTFRVSGVEKPYAFVLPAGAATTQKVTMRITDVWGRTIWTQAVRPNTNGAATEVVWTGRTSTGMLASAGMYVVRVSVLDNGKNTDYVRKSVTLKSR